MFQGKSPSCRLYTNKIKKKYLLNNLPENLESCESYTIEQAYLSDAPATVSQYQPVFQEVPAD